MWRIFCFGVKVILSEYKNRKVKAMSISEFTSEEKHVIVDILNDTVVINKTRQTVLNAIKYYCRSVFDALNEGDLSLIKFYSL